MPCPHNEISIVQRSQRQSAVAAAAYQSGEKLFCEYDQEVKHYPEKRGIVHNEILLPANAPPEYADRNTLWNAAEAVEKQWNSQLARRWVLTIPREIPPYQYAALVREFCKQQFVSKGMIVDFAIHDPNPPGHNPHAHVMLTMRAMDGHGKWLPKSRKVYDLDENGERIKLPSGRWKSHKEDTVDWNDRKYCEIWRHEWEVIQNRYLEANNRPERVDLRSYARQGLDIVPTVHEGAAVRQMEKRGIQTNIGNLNREIKAANRLMQSIRQLIKNLKSWITELGEKRKELLAQKAAEEATLLPNLLMKYMEIDLNVFVAVKQSVTTRQAAEHYGIRVGRNGMACCPFHNDKTPSMKLDRRYHCFGCGADGDVIDFAAALYGLGKKEAAVQLAQDFGLSYEDWKPPGKEKKPKPRQKSPEEQFQEAKNRCFRILADYLHLLRAWRTDYAPHSPEEAFHPRFIEALQKQDQVEYLLDVLLFGETEEKAALITDYGKDVIQLEQRMAELAAADAARTKKHHERHAATPEH